MRTFYVHQHRQPGKLPNANPRGFTMKISQADDPRKINIQVTYCSPKDQFCKKTGRDVVENKTKLEIFKADLPKEIAAANNRIHGWESNPVWPAASFNHMLKYLF